MQLEERGCHDLMHCYILDFIVQNFVYLNDSGKMPSDKAALCTPAFITPDANSTAKESGGADFILIPPTARGKDGVDFITAIKTKRQSELNLQLPLPY